MEMSVPAKLLETNERGIAPGCVASKYSSPDCTEFPEYSKKYASGQSGRHREMVDRAVAFLENMGCTGVCRECVIKLGKPYSHPPRLIKVDVLGIVGGVRVIVECGGIHGYTKQLLLRKLLDAYNIFILPYGDTCEPFRWDGRSVCPTCGHELCSRYSEHYPFTHHD